MSESKILNLSYTRAAVARSCPKKYYWKYVEGLTPITKPSALTLGKIIHEVFDLYYKRLKSDKECESYIINSFDKVIQNKPLQEQESLYIAKYTALGMWRNYPYKNLNEFEEISTEKSFSVRIGKMRRVRYVGKIDGLVKKNGKWWVREIKTSALTHQQLQNRIERSGQATGYVYSARKIGYAVVGCMYDCIKKPLLRKRLDETVHDFGKRILEDYADKKKSRLYFSGGQHYVYRNDFDLKTWEDDMVELVKEIRKRNKRGYYYMNTDACFMFNAECPYLKLCRMPYPDKLTMELYYERGGER